MGRAETGRPAGPAPVLLSDPYGYPRVCPYPPGRCLCDVHLRVEPDVVRPGPEVAECADVLVSRTALSPPAARRRVAELLDRYPGCLVVAVPGRDTGCLVGVRGADGTVRRVRPGPDGSGTPAPPGAIASFVHAWVTAGGSLDGSLSVTVTRHA
ncbi:hypothetical protein [Streptomyces sp. NPDC087294]|uniref:hypothetical protein n=1 Tax=Streptomyces sp. NPDC087294 TaxID=3365777 RepID=UPI003823875E